MYKLIGLTLLVATVSALTTIEPTTTTVGRIIWKCESEISNYTDTFCAQQCEITGCYFLEHFETCKSCALTCNGVEEHSIDEERCNDQYCPGYLSQDGGCTLVHEVDTTTTAETSTNLTTTTTTVAAPTSDRSVINSSSRVVPGVIAVVCLVIGVVVKDLSVGN